MRDDQIRALKFTFIHRVNKAIYYVTTRHVLPLPLKHTVK